MIHGIGIDTVEISRFKKALERWGDRLATRLFTPDELSYCRNKKNPERHFSARFAAKVSLFKALGRPLKYRDVEISRDESGAPSISAKGLEKGLRLRVSIAHDGDLSIAETIIEKNQ